MPKVQAFAVKGAAAAPAATAAFTAELAAQPAVHVPVARAPGATAPAAAISTIAMSRSLRVNDVFMQIRRQPNGEPHVPEPRPRIDRPPVIHPPIERPPVIHLPIDQPPILPVADPLLLRRSELTVPAAPSATTCRYRCLRERGRQQALRVAAICPGVR